MSALEPQVRVLYRPGESLTPGYPWAHECEGCDETSGYWAMREDCQRYATEHENTCAAIQLARIQARWDARDAALRALIRRWQGEAHNRQMGGLSDRGYASAMHIAADELEQALQECRHEL